MARRHAHDDNANPEIAEPDISRTNEIPVVEDSMSIDDESLATNSSVTQAEVYDNLKRIGELEDEKKRIQEEIYTRTEQLRDVIAHIDRGSILYKMLESALKDFKPKSAASSNGTRAAKGASKVLPKASKKKSRRK
jgi:hypothetical protein